MVFNHGYLQAYIDEEGKVLANGQLKFVRESENVKNIQYLIQNVLSLYSKDTMNMKH